MTDYEKVFHVLYKKVNKELFSVINSDAAAFIEKNCFVAGGALRSLINNETINDIDFFFRTEEAKKIFLDKFVKELGIKLIVSTKNAITYEYNPKVQFILLRTGTPEEVIKTFDFTNSMGYYCPNDQTLDIKAMHNVVKNKQLYFNPKCTTPLMTLKRLVKFANQGYKIDPEELIEMMRVITPHLNNKSEVKEFIVGDGYGK